MEQRLIVEGKDAIVLTSICMKRKMNPPKGYRNPQKYKTKFVKEADGINKVEFALVEELQSPDVTNIGIIVDANNEGVKSKLASLKRIIEDTLVISLNDLKLEKSGCCFEAMENLKIGIWVMPNNQDSGYLEHFMGNLVPNGNSTWEHATQKVAELMENDFCEFTKVKQQKVLIHTYLAWKTKPGLPMGTAVRANYFDASLPAANDFVEWFKGTFQLEN